MLKFVYLNAALSSSLILFVAEATLSSQYSMAQNSNSDTLICYMQTGDGKTLNLTHLCKHTRNTAADSPIDQLLTTKSCPKCKLNDAKLSGANLVGADLSNADLSNADLSNANLLGAKLTGANVTNAKLNGAIMPDGNIHK